MQNPTSMALEISQVAQYQSDHLKSFQFSLACSYYQLTDQKRGLVMI